MSKAFYRIAEGGRSALVYAIIFSMSQERLTRHTVQRVAENRIREAMENGEFDNLPGLGKPIPDIDEPYDPMWWVKQWFRREKLAQAMAEKVKPTSPNTP
ncbi:MAG: hypothetical protein QOJ16_3409 [Acidobacteriota bacterium]|jgi:hypothetical protein|nr:hypothetical protein [Acidobacteriota bacterium]